MDRIKKFNDMQPIAEKFYMEGDYVRAKETYRCMLTLCRPGTYKEQRVLSCIDDMQEQIDINNAMHDAEMTEPLRKKLKDISDEIS